jgi:branched-chain amino acid transport system ATP-binding protein
MLNCVSGRYTPTDGRVLIDGRDVTQMRPSARAGLGIGRTFQNLALFSHMSVLDNIMVGRHHLLRNNVLTGSLYWLAGAQKEELAHRREIEEIIDFLEIAHIRKAPAGTLPYGLRKRVELARAVALKPRLLLLDEPMAGMNLEEKEDMARFINDLNEEWGMTVVMIEHDMAVVVDISHRLLVLDFGRKIAEGEPEAVMGDPGVRKAYLGADADAEPAEDGAATAEAPRPAAAAQ